MTEEAARTLWSSGEAYERYVGRWSRLVAAEFLHWINPVPGLRWLDVGCGTGVLTDRVLSQADPRVLLGVEPSRAFVTAAARGIADRRAGFSVGAAQALPVRAHRFDVVVSGLVLNFVPDLGKAAAEFAQVLRPGATAAAYVWDYAGEMQMIRHFWDAAIALHPAARELDEGSRFSICRPNALAGLFHAAGFVDVETRAIDVTTTFADFDDYWQPFLSGGAPAPAYVMSLDAGDRDALCSEVRRRLPAEPDGSISLIARAWAVKGRTPKAVVRR